MENKNIEENLEVKSDIEKSQCVKDCIQKLIQNSDFSIERLYLARKEIEAFLGSNKFESESLKYSYISGYATSFVDDSIRWFSSINNIAEKAYDNLVEFEDTIEFEKTSNFDMYLSDCLDGIKLSSLSVKEKGDDANFIAAEFIRGSINDLTKALEYLGFNREAINIRNEIEVLKSVEQNNF